jgi:hypothetical protein
LVRLKREDRKMKKDDIEVGGKYRCDYKGKQHFATVVSKGHKNVGVTLGDIINKDGDPGDPTQRLGTLGILTVSPEKLHPL